MGIKTVPHPPYGPDLFPVTFAYSLSREAVVMRQLRRWKRRWRRSLTRSHKKTSLGPSRSCWNGTTRALQLEEITSKSFMSVLSIKVPIRKSLETYLMILVYKGCLRNSKPHINPRVFLKDITKTLLIMWISVRTHTIQHCLNRNGLYRKWAWQTTLHKPCHIVAWFKFAKTFLDKENCFWDQVL